MKQVFKVARIIKLLDDFLFIGASKSECEAALSSFEFLCNKLGLPLAQEKTVRPSKRVTFLGVELDSELNKARLPKDKLLAYKDHLQGLINSKFCTQKEFKTIIGKLQFATCIIRGG